MSSSSAQSWTRRMRAGHYDNIRVSDAERAEVTDLLARHYSDGRLDKQEFDDRVARAMSAKTRADLARLFDDLPDLEPPAGEAGEDPRADAPARPYGVGRRCGRPHPILGLIAFLVIASFAWHVLAHVFFFPGIAILLLVAVILFANRSPRRARRDR